MRPQSATAKGHVAQSAAANRYRRNREAAERQNERYGQPAKREEAEGCAAESKNTNRTSTKRHNARGQSADSQNSLRPATDGNDPFRDTHFARFRIKASRNVQKR